ncbi:Homoaconitase [Candidatus Sulfotelmatobacter kueseliae]|uniref:Aconitate hydratase A n=1 Tax=Candidatus Sulfotelmatobacter kueseliae TaxID=2042962 RepID=A0A2U3LD24_9BACT|nr:Homoaconitase [Candidatus Sulfotelmatobacter kueseliae]
MPQTIVEKIAQAHMAEGPNRPLRAGDFLSIRPFHVMTHDNTSAVMSKFKGIGAKKVRDAGQLVFALDHDIQNQDEANLKKYRSIEAFAKEHGVDFYPAGSGIGHQIMVERGYVVPGSFVVASDSHSNMYGALGAVGTPIVRTDAAAVWATGEFWWQIPRTIQVVLEGKLPDGVTGKDVIIALCGLYNHDEALNAAVEFSGPGVASLPMDARFSISNMSTEWGPLVGWFPVDAVTLEYLRGVHQRLQAMGIERFTEADIARWAANPPLPDSDAAYAARIVLDLNQVTPHVSGPDTVQVMQSVAEIEKKKVAIQKAYLLSCVNSRAADLEAAARVLRGKKVAPSVKFYLGAASAWVQQEAEKRGAWQALLEAGAIPLPPSCGPCIGLGTGLLEKGEVGISATNRNFKGRMGSRDAQCYLASPEVVAASAVAGYITGPSRFADRTPVREYQEFASGGYAAERVEILPGFPERVRGRLVFMPQDNVNTDAIYGKDYTYRDDMTPEMMARVVMENYDPQFAERTRAGDVIVGGFNFGTGSSREQAVTCLKAKGIPLVIAASFSQTYLRNAYNNGFLCIEVPALVKRLREQFASEIAAKEKTIIPGEEVDIAFTSGTLTWHGESFVFPPLGTVPQSLVIAGGAENVVARKLGLIGQLRN